MEVRHGTHKFYKGSYLICFYDKTGEIFKYMFDNVRDILAFQNKEINRQNVNLINVELRQALNSETKLTRFLNGELLKVYLVDID